MAAQTEPWVKRSLFLGFLWGGVAISSLFVFLRLAIRVKAFRRLWSDDGLVILAWLFSIGAAILWQMVATALYNQYKLSTGKLVPTPDVLKKEKELLHGTVAFLFLFHTCIYSIKASFLLFFRRLDSRYDGPRRKWWWFVTVITLAAYITSWGTIQWKCLLGSYEFIFTQCVKEASLKYEHSTFIYQCAIDVISDLLIISIPIIMLWNVKLRLRKKIALMALFSLTVIVMGTSITRVSVIPTSHTQADVSWLYFWHNLEMAVTLVVSSLASFRQLFVMQSQGTSKKPRTKSSKSSSNFKSLLLSARTPPRFLSTPQSAYQATASKDDIVPLRSIYVSHNVGVSTVPSRGGISLQKRQEDPHMTDNMDLLVPAPSCY